MMTEATESTAPFEARVEAAMGAVVAGETAPPAVRAAVADLAASPAPAAGRRPPVRWLVGAAAVALIVFIGVLSLRPDGGDADVAATTDSPGATFDTVPPTTASTLPPPMASVPSPSDTVPDPIPTPTTAAPTPTTGTMPSTMTPVAPTPTTAVATPTTAAPLPVCRNSVDAACGSFRWDPPPSNQAARLVLEIVDGPVIAGQPFTVRATLSDPDSPVSGQNITITPSQGPATSSDLTVRHTCPARFGPWTPPAGRSGREQTETTFTFADAGPASIRIDIALPPVESDQFCPNVNPYLSSASATIPFTVQPAP